MSVHVDIVRNDWLGGEQRPVARLYVAGGGLKIDSPDSSRWRPVVEEALGDLLRSELSSEKLLAEATRVLAGSHLLATQPHSEAECAFRAWASAPIESVSSDRRPAPAGL